MTAGRGYLALAAVIFGGWRVWGVLGASLAFGFTDALQLRIQGGEAVPGEVWALIAVVFAGYVAWYVLRTAQPGPRARYAVPVVVGGFAVLCAIFALTTPSIDLPNELWLALPYVVTLVALAGLGARDATPRFLGLSYNPARAVI